jgi:hypothetical protein
MASPAVLPPVARISFVAARYLATISSGLCFFLGDIITLGNYWLSLCEFPQTAALCRNTIVLVEISPLHHRLRIRRFSDALFNHTGIR